MQETANSGVLKGSLAETKERGSLPRFIDIHLVRENKFDILVEGCSASIKHGMRFSISIISS